MTKVRSGPRSSRRPYGSSATASYPRYSSRFPCHRGSPRTCHRVLVITLITLISLMRRYLVQTTRWQVSTPLSAQQYTGCSQPAHCTGTTTCRTCLQIPGCARRVPLPRGARKSRLPPMPQGPPWCLTPQDSHRLQPTDPTRSQCMAAYAAGR